MASSRKNSQNYRLEAAQLAFNKVEAIYTEAVAVLRDLDKDLEFALATGIFPDISTETAGVFVLKYYRESVGWVFLKKVPQDDLRLVFGVFTLLTVDVHGNARVKKTCKIATGTAFDSGHYRTYIGL